MKRVLRILFVIGFLLIALVVAGVAVLSSMDFNQYKGLIAEQASDATGRKLIIDGELELNISLNPSVSVDGVSFANASWGSKPEMLTLERFAAEISLIPLLSGDIQVKRVVLYGADLLLETDGLSVIGEGGIDLREEKLNLYFDPRAKSASVVSVAEIGISVGGTLKDPSFTADKADVLLGAASLATGIATGGVSILLGAVLDTVANEIDSTDYCALALAGKPLQPGQPAGDVPSSPKQQEQPPVQEETPEENPVEGLLNNLLGN